MAGQKYGGKIGQIQKKTWYPWWNRKIANAISKIDVHVEYIFWEHNQEADHWAKLGAEGQRKIIVDRSNNTQAWNAVKGLWDGSFKNNGRSGCGVVIK